MNAINLFIAVLPVLALLGLGVVMDGYKLVPLRSVARSIVVGGLAAGGAMVAYIVLVDRLDLVPTRSYVRYLAPAVEELLKAAFIVYRIRAGRVGFVVDAAIHGFAVGAGFALVENVYYLNQLENAPVVVWVIRGFGTAVLHGSTTAMFAVLGKGISDRRNRAGLAEFLPGFALAVIAHALYNRFLVNPVISAFILTVGFPVLLLFVFTRSERATRNWLGDGFDMDADLLETILSEEITETRVGKYLSSLRKHFPGPVVGDMLCLIRIQLELGMRAKGMLLAREAGLEVTIGDDVKAGLEELGYLEKSIGKTGLRAMRPVLQQSRRDLWQLYVLRKQPNRGA